MMVEPIEANYVPEGDDWAITVTGHGKSLTDKAPGLIAARDRADQLVESLAPNEEHHTVVHLINGDPVEFTDMYLHARLDMGGAASGKKRAGDGKAGKPTGGPADRPAGGKTSS
jgi:hypothetical protein